MVFCPVYWVRFWEALKGNQWYFGMKAYIGVDAGAGYQEAKRRPDVADHPHLS